MIKLIVAAVLALALAGSCTPTTHPKTGAPVKGEIVNWEDSATSIYWYTRWDRGGPAGEKRSLKPGDKTPAGRAAGMCVPNGYRARVRIDKIGTVGWTIRHLSESDCLRISDTQRAYVTVTRDA